MLNGGLHLIGFKLVTGSGGELLCNLKFPHALAPETWTWERFIHEFDVPGTVASFVRGEKRLLEAGVPCWVRKVIIGITGAKQDPQQPGKIDIGANYHLIDLKTDYTEASSRRKGPLDETVLGIGKRWWLVLGEIVHDHFFFGQLQDTDLASGIEEFRCFFSDLIVEYVGPIEDWNHLNRFCLDRRGKTAREISQALIEYDRALTVLRFRRDRVKGLLRVYDAVSNKLSESETRDSHPAVARARVLSKKTPKGGVR